MKKLKLKKGIKKRIYLIVILTVLVSVFFYSSIKIYKQKEYEKTYEYKLLTLGYDEKETKFIIKKLKNKEIDYLLNVALNDDYLEIIKDKFFIYDNFYDYIAYLEENSDNSIRDVIEIINTNRDEEYYTDTTKTDINKKELMLINKYYYLDENYEPENLVTVSQNYSWGEEGSQQITKDTYDAYKKMWKSANEDGFHLMINSSYRTYEEQEDIYDSFEKSNGLEYADAYAARPGYSEHQTGYTIDMFEKNNYKKETFHESDVYKWLQENAHKYGFILRYPEDKEDVTGYSFESWHYRYVGINAATYIYENDITFDEYYAYFVK